MKKIYLVIILMFSLVTTAFSNTISLLNIENIQSTGFNLIDTQAENFVIVQKIRKGINEKNVIFLQDSSSNLELVSKTLIENRIKFFIKKQIFSVNNAIVVKYIKKDDPKIYLFDITFKSIKNPDLFVSISYVGKSTLNTKEISALIKEAESFLK